MAMRNQHDLPHLLNRLIIALDADGPQGDECFALLGLTQNPIYDLASTLVTRHRQGGLE